MPKKKARKKVYCEHCKWIDREKWEYRDKYTDWCDHPKNRKSHYYSSDNYIRFQCGVMNKNNRCKYFEKKELKQIPYEELVGKKKRRWWFW